MDSAILYFNQLFVFEAIHRPKQPLCRARFDNGTSTILDRQPVSKRYCRGILRFSLKAHRCAPEKTEVRKVLAPRAEIYGSQLWLCLICFHVIGEEIQKG